jgi:general secretion pathway protein G
MDRRKTGRSTAVQSKGFTLIEMMVVISIILILLGVGIPIYSHSIMRAREDNLRKNLETLNYMIYQYGQDKQKAPQSLDDLKSAGYIKSIPDDITGNPDTWEIEPGEDVILSLDQTEPGGIVGVHSGSNQIGSDGKAYSTW